MEMNDKFMKMPGEPNMPAMNMAGDPAPEGMRLAIKPKFPVGTKVILTTNHMPGMMNAKAVVVGAYYTTLYQVDFYPTNGGPEVKGHKWVAQEELQYPYKKPEIGEMVTVEADHMQYMKGAKAKIDAMVTGNSYMVNYMPTTGGPEVTNHKWLMEDEMKLAED